jgi:hypothetical protein
MGKEKVGKYVTIESSSQKQQQITDKNEILIKQTVDSAQFEGTFHNSYQ